MDRGKLTFVNISEIEELLDIAQEIKDDLKAGVNPNVPADIMEYAERALILLRDKPGLVFRAIVEDWALDVIIVAIDDHVPHIMRESSH